MTENIIEVVLPVDEKLMIRRNRIKGGTSKKRVCIVTGTHGDELEGQYVCFRMAQELRRNLHKLNGTVEIWPALNPLGVDSIMRGIPGFDLDMNRIFPGERESSMAESVAHRIIGELQGADMVIDIHSSNIFLREVPQARINVLCEEQLRPCAMMLNLDFIWIHDAATVLEATLAHSLNTRGTRCVVVEMGVGMRVNHSCCNRLVTGIFNLLNHMGMWREATDPDELSTPLVSKGSDSVAFLNARASGIFVPESKTDTMVVPGDHIGDIVSSLTGDVLEHVVAPVAGYLFTIRAYPVVYEGSLIARIHKL